MRQPIIQLSLDFEQDFSSKRNYNRLSAYVGEYYQQKLPRQDYGLVKKILIRFSEGGKNRAWLPSKGDPILTLDYPAELKAIMPKSTYDVVDTLDNLLIESLKAHSEHLPLDSKFFENISSYFRESGFEYTIELQKKRSPNKKDYGVVHVDMTPEKAIFYGVRLSSKNKVLNKIKFIETIPSLYAVAGIVDKTKWLSENEFLVSSKIGAQYNNDFEKNIYVELYEGNEKMKELSEIELKLLAPNTTLEEIIELQAIKKSVLFG